MIYNQNIQAKIFYKNKQTLKRLHEAVQIPAFQMEKTTASLDRHC